MKRLSSILLVFFLLFGAFRLGQQNPVQIDPQSGLDVAVANSVWDVVEQNYLRVNEIDRDELKYGLAKGLVNSLGDIHSSFMDPAESVAFMQGLQGDLEGIGAELRLVEGAVEVVSPLPGSPAEKAGIRPGDIILKVDGDHLGVVDNLFDVVMLIRGPKGSSVTLSVLPKDDVSTKDVTIVRDSIHLDAVTWEEVEANGQRLAKVRLSTFTDHVGEEFKRAVQEVNEAGISKMVLDLRFNGGGYLDGAVDVGSVFVDPNKELVNIKDQNGTQSRFSSDQGVRFDGRVVILVNDSSASASEIVAGALQDYGIAHVIGTTTFGKGSVQEVHPFFDNSLLRITVAEWLTPKMRSIEGKGIEPDQVLDLDFDKFLEGDDTQMDAALDYLTT